MKLRAKRILRTLLLLVLLAVLVWGVVLFQRRQFTTITGIRTYQEKMYLPNADKLKLVTLGFEHLYADLLWLRAIQAFGSRWEAGGDMKPVFHYFDVITDLDPHFVEAYNLGNLVIGDEGGDYQRSLDILRKGMIYNPWDWELPYLGIYNSVWQMEDYEQGRWFAHMAARVPGRPEFVARMQEYVERKSGRLELAFGMNIQYLLRYLDDGNDVEARLTSQRIWDVLDRWYTDKMIEAARRFIAETGKDPRSLDQLVRSDAWESFRAPTMQALADAIQKYENYGPRVSPYQDQIREESYRTVTGEPPDPTGYGYVILDAVVDAVSNTTGTLAVSRETANDLPRDHFRYIISRSRLRDAINDYLISLTVRIQKYKNEHGKFPDTLEAMGGERIDYEDPLGGRVVYDPETGRLRSTGIEKTSRKWESILIY